MALLTIENVKERLAVYGIELIDTEYIGTRSIYRFICPICKKEFSCKLEDILYDKKRCCIECRNKAVSEKYKGKHLTFTYEDLLKRIEDRKVKMKFPKKYKVEDEVVFICECGNEFITKLKNVLYKGKTKCEKCSSQLKDENLIRDEIKKLVGDEYSLIGEYKGSKKKITAIHNVCGHEYGLIPYNFITHGHRCPKCANSLPITLELAKEICLKLFPDKEYEVIDFFKVKTYRYLKLIHNKCGEIFIRKYDNFIYSGARCSVCTNKYKGERLIFDLLTLNDINFKTQYKFEDCRYKNPLPFDFAVFDGNDNLKCLIEYDGEGHFIPVNIFGGKSGLESVKIRDNIKNEYCKNNNINLIRIPYTEFDNIEEILKNII